MNFLKQSADLKQNQITLFEERLKLKEIRANVAPAAGRQPGI